MARETSNILYEQRRIRERVNSLHGGITTRWAVCNQVKRKLQEWGVAQHVVITDGRSKEFTAMFDMQKVNAIILRSEAVGQMLQELVKIANDHGYQSNIDTYDTVVIEFIPVPEQ